jgi:hypothetical protein
MRFFRTTRYSAAWFPCGPDRNATRLLIQTALREALGDPDGRLEVDREGPHWRGNSDIGLSYAHDEDSVFAVWTPDGRPVGVDLEPADRVPKRPVEELAARFFHEAESRTISRLSGRHRVSAFLELWLKKEAVAKLTRKGLVHSLPLQLDALSGIEFEEPALLPRGKRAVLAFFKNPTG